MQDLQKVQSALAVRALKTGKQIVADHGAITVAPLVSSPRVIGADVRRRLQSRCPHGVFLLVESVLPLCQDATELALGYIDAEIVQTL